MENLNKFKNSLTLLINFILIQRFICTIDLEKTYESCFEPGDSLENIMAAKTNKSLHSLLKYSVYVQFLINLKDKITVTDTEIQQTKYYQESWDCVHRYGSYQGRIKTDVALIEHCRGFLDLFEIFKKRVTLHGCQKSIQTIKDHYTYGYPDIFQIINSPHTMVYDGAHRLACLYVLGEKFARVKVIGIIKGPIRII